MPYFSNRTHTHTHAVYNNGFLQVGFTILPLRSNRILTRVVTTMPDSIYRDRN